MLEMSPVIDFLLEFKYLGILGGVFVGGEALLLVIGFLVSLGIFKIHLAIPLAILGVLLGDIGWYILGRKGRKLKFIAKLKRKIGEEKIKNVESKFKNHSIKTILLVRIIYGLRSIILFMAGVTKMNFFSFISLNFIGTFLWGMTLILIGYFFGQSLVLLQNYIENIILLISIAVFLTAAIFASIYFTKKSLNKKM
jgi:membrane protein DedA with SNARE-associated domain